MRVVHLCLTPVAGGPWNTVTALNAHSDVEARLVVLNPSAYGLRTFPDDLVWQRDRDESLAVLAAADAVHLHQWFDPAAWFGPEVGAICAMKPCIRQFHSELAHFVGDDPAALDHILTEPMPHLVIAQFHERYYPRARVVPNLVPLGDPLLSSPNPQEHEFPCVAWSPTVHVSAWDSRWATKGYPETRRMLERLSKEQRCTVDVIENVPRDECLRRKGAADLVIDEMVTGSYHLSGLEGLAQGKPVLGWLDERTQIVLRELTGASVLPWVNAHLEDAEGVLRALLADRNLRAAIGAESRAWMERWYNDRVLVQYYVRAYRDLLERPDLFARMGEADLVAHWRNVRLPDLIWEARRERGRENKPKAWQQKIGEKWNAITSRSKSRK